jgi:hypothetical protein
LLEKDMYRFLLSSAIAIAALLLAATAFAAGAGGGRDSIDPGRISQPGVWGGDIIDPQSLRPAIQPAYMKDPGTVRLEKYQWQNADPGPVFNPIVPETWASTHEIVIKALPGNQNVDASAVVTQLAPATLDEFSMRAPDNTVMNPVDPGQVEMRATLFGRVDPGRMADKLGAGPGGGEGRSAIFSRDFETPPLPAGASGRRAKIGW